MSKDDRPDLDLRPVVKVLKRIFSTQGVPARVVLWIVIAFVVGWLAR